MTRRLTLEEWHVRRKSRRTFRSAIASGLLSRQPCEVCGTSAEGHHAWGYDRPLEVQWLCRPHHAAAHRETRPRPEPRPVPVRPAKVWVDATELRRERVARGISMAELARRIGRDRVTVWRWEGQEKVGDQQAAEYRAALR